MLIYISTFSNIFFIFAIATRLLVDDLTHKAPGFTILDVVDGPELNVIDNKTQSLLKISISLSKKWTVVLTVVDCRLSPCLKNTTYSLLNTTTLIRPPALQRSHPVRVVSAVCTSTYRLRLSNTPSPIAFNSAALRYPRYHRDERELGAPRIVLERRSSR